MNTEETLALMLNFRRAWARRDRDGLTAVLAPDFVWHGHRYDPANPEPTGTVIQGIDGVMAEITVRSETWSDVVYDGMFEHVAPGIVTQTFRISGAENGQPFNVDAVDLYRITDDGLIASKDTYWKQPAAG